jgi:hypothetical protein
MRLPRPWHSTPTSALPRGNFKLLFGFCTNRRKLATRNPRLGPVFDRDRYAGRSVGASPTRFVARRRHRQGSPARLGAGLTNDQRGLLRHHSREGRRALYGLPSRWVLHHRGFLDSLAYPNRKSARLSRPTSPLADGDRFVEVRSAFDLMDGVQRPFLKLARRPLFEPPLRP